jgi:hypothetical protein
MRNLCPLLAAVPPAAFRGVDPRRLSGRACAKTHAPVRGLPRVAAALCGGALVGAVSVALLLIVVGTVPPSGGGESTFVPSNLLFAYFIFLFTAPAALAIGIPSYYLLVRRGMLNSVAVGAVGTVAGAGVGMLLRRGIPSAAELLTFAGIGVVCALAALFLLLRSDPAHRTPPEQAMG